MTDATELDEAAIRARVDAATKGPWRWDSWRDDLHHLIGRGGSPETYEYDVEVIEPEHSGECGCRSACYLSNSVSEADREFIAHARTDLPDALDEITRLRAALDEARGELRHWTDIATDEQIARQAAEQDRDEERARVDEWRDLAAAKNTRAEAAESALASIRTLARTWSGRHDLLMTGDSAAHDIEAALAAPTTAEGDDR